MHFIASGVALAQGWEQTEPVPAPRGCCPTQNLAGWGMGASRGILGVTHPGAALLEHQPLQRDGPPFPVAVTPWRGGKGTYLDANKAPGEP